MNPVLSLLFLAQGPPQTAPVVVDEIVAIVNDQVLTRKQVELRARNRAIDLGAGVDPSQLYYASLQSMLLDLLFQEGFKLEGDPLFLEGIVQDELKRQTESAGSLASLIEQLRVQGLTLEDYTAKLRREIMALLFQYGELGLRPVGGKNGVKNEVGFVGPSEMEAYYNKHISLFISETRVQARMILLLEEPGQPGAADRIQALEQRIRGGEIGFEDAAAQFSRYRPSTRGNMGLVAPASEQFQQEFQKPIRDFVAAAGEGEMSPPLQLNNGWALVLVERIRRGGVAPLNDRGVQETILAGIAVDPEATELALDQVIGLRRAREQQIFQDAVRRLRDRCYLWGADVDRVLNGFLAEAEAEAEF